MSDEDKAPRTAADIVAQAEAAVAGTRSLHWDVTRRLLALLRSYDEALVRVSAEVARLRKEE